MRMFFCQMYLIVLKVLHENQFFTREDLPFMTQVSFHIWQQIFNFDPLYHK
jgi:hypothetical protein